MRGNWGTDVTATVSATVIATVQGERKREEAGRFGISQAAPYGWPKENK
jgi:hypothetical protein